MTPEEYVKELCDPGQPPGAQFCEVREFAERQGWTRDQILRARDLIMDRYNAGLRFEFPKKVRYV